MESWESEWRMSKENERGVGEVSSGDLRAIRVKVVREVRENEEVREMRGSKVGGIREDEGRVGKVSEGRFRKMRGE